MTKQITAIYELVNPFNGVPQHYYLLRKEKMSELPSELEVRKMMEERLKRNVRSVMELRTRVVDFYDHKGHIWTCKF